MKDTVKRIFTHGCVLFTVLSVSVYAISAAFSGKLTGWIPKLDTIFMLLIMSFAVCAANLLLSNEKIAPALRVPIHFAVLGVAYYLLFVVWNGLASSGSMTFIALLVYAVIYAFAIGIYFIIKSAKKKKASDKTEYTSMFGK